MSYSRYVKWCVDHRRTYCGYEAWLDVMRWNAVEIMQASIEAVHERDKR